MEPRSVLHPDDMEIIQESLQSIDEEKEQVSSLEFRARHRNGRYVWLNTNLSPILDENGDVESIVAVAQDVTSKKENDNRILQYNDLLKLINKILRHDLTNNLFMIRSALEQYQITEEDMWLDSSFKKIDMSYDLIEQMRSLESILLKGGALRVVDIREALERIKIGFDIPIDIDCGCKVMADDAFYSVIENLIRNAIVHGETEKMSFICRDHGNGMSELHVIDYGCGIPDRVKEKIFDESFTHGKKAGTGLGLYIVKNTIERYGGSVLVEDNPDGGTIFKLKLPLATISS